MKKLAILTLISLITCFARAQPNSSSDHKEEMKKLDFLTGSWAGEGWIQMGPQGKEDFTQTEHIQKKLDGTLLLIEGLGKDKQDESKIVHNAFAIISYDPQKQSYEFQSYLADGKQVSGTAKVNENTLVWGFDTPQGAKIKYSIVVDDQDQWSETGEYSPDGTNWMKFFEMTLLKNN
ncbi:MAG: DUF1579 family protein [Cyclobacteriaceae bacterium]